MRSDAVPPGAVRAVELEGVGRVAVWRTDDGAVSLLDDRCPHQWSSLAIAGDVEGCELVCTSHGWRFTVDGRASKRSILGRRDDKGTTVAWPVRESDGWIEAELDVPVREGEPGSGGEPGSASWPGSGGEPISDGEPVGSSGAHGLSEFDAADDSLGAKESADPIG